MAYKPTRALQYGAVEIYEDKTLGVGSYGKVCRAKCGNLPCAAKLLHSTLFQFNDPGANHLLKKFEQECEFLSTIKHPNIVQFIMTAKRSGRSALLMELMDESLTRFLERSNAPPPYHSQVNICHDVSLAISFLHTNDIIHRDLSSNNILLIAGSRAKVTDFGMSKLIDTNPRTTPLTQVPGTQVYMPPEALMVPPQYTHKLDCFSFGVLVIQILTSKFPDPGDATRFVEDRNYPTGRIITVIPERERRKEHIGMINRQHPLLLVALDCIKDRDEERPSSSYLCNYLPSLKQRKDYKDSERDARDQFLSVQMLQTNLAKSEDQVRMLQNKLAKKREQSHVPDFRGRVQELEVALKTKEQDFANYQGRVRAEKERCLWDYQERERRLQETLERERVRNELQAAREQELLLSQARDNQRIRELTRALGYKDEEVRNLSKRLSECEDIVSNFQKMDLHSRKAEIHNPPPPSLPKEKILPKAVPKPGWIQGSPPPDEMTARNGQVTIHKSTAVFTQDYLIYLYSEAENWWTELPKCRHKHFGVAVIKDTFTAIGGLDRSNMHTKVVLSLTEDPTGEKTWKERLQPMQTGRVYPATAVIPTHLIVAAGTYVTPDGKLIGYDSTEVMDLASNQWSIASNLPVPVRYPQFTISEGTLFLANIETNHVFSCSVEVLLSKVQQGNDGGPVWMKQADIPVHHGSCIVTCGGCVLAVGGCDESERPIKNIYRFDKGENSWKFAKTMLTERYWVQCATCPGDMLVVVGGFIGQWKPCRITEKIKWNQHEV